MASIVERRQAQYDAALERMNAANTAIQELESDDTLDTLQAELDEAVAEVERCKRNLEDADRLARSTEDTPIVVEQRNTAAQTTTSGSLPGAGEARASSDARVTREELIYREDQHGFLADVVRAYRGVPTALERLHRHNLQMRDHGFNIAGREERDVTTSDPGAAGFVPPIYMSQAWAELPRAARPVADKVRKMPLPQYGTSISIPKVQSGVTVASQNGENTAISETDADSQTITVPVRTLAGMNDMSLQAFERTAPGWDMIVADDLRAAYDEELERQVLNGTGAAGQYLGIRAVSSVNTVAYTDATPTAAELHPKLYDAIQKIATNRKKQATHFIGHPRRSAWIASNLSTSFPLLQQGGLMQAVGQQDGGFTKAVAGLEWIDDPMVGTLLGAGTEDEIYAVYMPDFILMEDTPRFEVFRDVLSGTGEARLRLWSYSAFASARQPASISIISGTGLIAPTF